MSRIDMKVNVIAKLDANSRYDFHLEDQDGCRLESVVFEKDKFPGMTCKDEHLVRFKLVQEQGMTLEFAPGKNVALWVAQGTADAIPECPKTQPAQPNPIFYGDKSNGHMLTAVNTNPSQCFFSFALNFVDPKSATPTKLITYDPVGENKNGGVPFQNAGANYTALLLGIGSAALLGYVAYLFFYK